MNCFHTEEELNCMRESTNSEDSYAYAVAVIHRSTAVGHYTLVHKTGHIPRKISAAYALFLKLLLSKSAFLNRPSSRRLGGTRYHDIMHIDIPIRGDIRVRMGDTDYIML